MNIKAIALVGLFVATSGCTQFRKAMGASADADNDVLTGGPVTGTRIADLPEKVRKTLREREPGAEIADIEQDRQQGKVVYKISFAHPRKSPFIYIAEDGTVVGRAPNLK
jgi:uncharacterized membrane protein YkoI